MRSLGRGLQLVGLMVIPPLAILLQLNESISQGQMLIMAAFAITVFYLGRIIEGYAR